MVYGPTESNPVGGDHGPFLVALAAFLRPRTYLELGCATGIVLMGVEQHCEVAIGVDHASGTEFMGGAKRSTSFVRSDTVEYLKTLPADSIDLIFLDSSHEFVATLRELDEIERVLVPNGVLVMHDTYPPLASQAVPGYCGDVWRAAVALKKRPAFESMTLPAQYGLTLARKNGGRQLLWLP